jgi:hypothetical protein
MSVEQKLEELVGFTLPEGDAGVIDDHTHVKIYPHGSNVFAPLQHMQFIISGNQMAFDPNESYIQFQLKVKNTGAVDATVQALPWLSGGTQGLVRAVTIKTMSSTTLEQIEPYNRLAVLCDRWGLDDQFVREDEPYELMTPSSRTAPTQNSTITNTAAADLVYDADQTVQPLTDGAGIVNSSWYGELRKTYEPLDDTTGDAETGATYEPPYVKLKLRQSAILGGKKVFPLDVAGHLLVDIWLEEAAVAFCNVTAKSFETDGKVDAITEQVNPIMTTTAATSITYEITNPSFNCRMVRLSPHMREAISGAVNKNGLPFTIDTWYMSHTAISANNVGRPADISIPKNVANVQAVLAFMNLSDNETDKTDSQRDSFKTIHHGLDGFRVRWGTKYYPEYIASTTLEKYDLTKGAFPQLLARKMPGVSMFQYDPQKTKIFGQSQYTTSDTDTSGELWDTSCNRYALGVSMQNVKGLALSGVTTNSGNQITFQCDWDKTTTTATAKANAYRERLAELYCCIRYTRMLLFGPNQNVSVRE